eukprot:scaffold2300_cov160-Amphora_coffeaeformis.AAC.10
MGRGRRNYEQVTTNPEESAPESTAVVGDDANQRRRNNGNLHSAEVALLQEPQGVPVSDAESVSVVGEEDEGELITVVILDVAQKKFPVTLSPNSTSCRFSFLFPAQPELINLLALALGVPQEDPNSSYNNNYDSGDDDIFPSEDGGGMNNNTVTPGGSHEMAEWNMGNTFDFIISAMGVYVAIVGLKATTLNTLRLARTYLTGTFLTGIGWCLFNYVMTYKLDKEMAENHEESRDGMPPMSDDDLAWQALTVMVLPCMVWMLCCLRAWQFQYLLREAEQEAEDRIRSELANITGDSNGNPGDEGTLPAEAGTMA